MVRLHTPTAPMRPLRAVIALALGLATLLVMLLGTAGTANAAMGVSTTSSSSLSSLVLYLSKNAPATYNTQYVGVKVANDSTVRSDIWVKITDLTGGNVTLATGEPGERHVGRMAAGASDVSYFLFAASAKTNADTTFNIKLYDGVPGSGGQLISTTAATFTDVADSQNASANKVTGGYVTPAQPTLGSEFKVVLTGQSGTMANNGQAVFTPAFARAWDPAAFELIHTDLQFDFNPAGNRNFTDQLRFPTTSAASVPAGSLDTAGGAYTATYTFRAINRTTTSVRPSPVGHIQSGGLMKYTNAASLSSISPIEPVTNAFLITAEASPTRSADGFITYILTLSNTSNKTLSVDVVRDVLPTGTTYQPGTSSYAGAAIADPNVSGGVATWGGPFTVEGGARATLSYTVRATPTSTATDYSNSATGLVGSTVIDTTLDTADNLPASATATVDSDFTPDTTAPVITLTAVDGASAALADGGSTGSTGATMTFSADEAATLTCSLDGAVPAACTSPKVYSGLAYGSHTFWVYAKDASGNIGSRSIRWSIVNNAKPEVASFEPRVAATNTSPVTFTLTFTKEVDPATVTLSDLSLVTTGSPGTWTLASVVGSGTTYLVSASSASPGTSGTVAVRIAANSVTDGADSTLTGPSTQATSGAVTMTNTLGLSITQASPASGATSNSTSATFAFGPTAGKYPPDQYMCKGPGEASYTECSSPITYTGLTDGSQTFYVYGNALNADGTVAATTSSAPESSSWTVDSTGPVVTLTTPTAGAVLTNATPALGGACTTGDGSVSIPIYAGTNASGTPVQTASATCTSGAWTVDAATLADGQYTAQAEQTDTAGNTGRSAARTFSVDATKPTVTVAANAASTTTGSATFTITFSESITGFATGDLIIGGTSASPAWSATSLTGSAASYSVTLTTQSTPSVGTLTLAVSAGAVTDLAGNTGPASNSAAATVDVVSTGDLIDGSVTANDGNDWSAPVTRGGPGRSLPISKTAFSEVGGGSPSNKLYRKVASWSSGDCGTFDSGTEIPLATTTDDTSSLGDGCFRYALRGTNSNSTKSSTAESNVVKVDLTDPVVGDLSVAGGDNQLTKSAAPAIATGSMSDAASGLQASAEKLTRASTTFLGNACDTFGAYDASSETALSVSATADSGLASGCYRYTHSVSDNAGNVVTKQSVVKVDVDAPTGGSLTANGGAAWTKAASPSLSGSEFSDANSGVASGDTAITREKATLSGADCADDWAVDSSSVTDTGGADNATLTQACYRYSRTASDRAGNVSSTTPSVVKIDLTNPSTGSLSLAGGDNQLVNTPAPAIARGTETDSNSGINASAEKLTRAFAAYSDESCGTFAAYDPDAETTVSNSATADAGLGTGCYRYTRRVGDNAGNSATTASTVRVDVTDPVVGNLSIAGGDNQLTNSAAPGITTGSRSDAASGLKASDEKLTRASTSFTGNACGTFAAYDPAEEADIALDAASDSGLASGCYRYTHRVADNAGNTVTTQGVVKVDVNDPVNGSLTVNSGNAWASSQKPALTGNPFTDTHSGIAAGAASFMREKATLNGATCNNDWAVDQGTVDDSGGAENDTLVQACYRYTRAATDRAGNSAQATGTVKIDRTNPTGGAVTANGGNGTWTKDAKPALTRSSPADANSGLASEALTRGFAAFNGSGDCTGVTYSGSDAVTIDGNGRDADAGTLVEGCYRYRSTAADNAGNSTTDDATVFIDRTNPTGGSVRAAGGAAWTDSQRPMLSGNDYTDANSGVATSSLTRAQATLDGQNCDSFGSETAVTVTGGADDDTLAQGCYRYTKAATDNAGNSTQVTTTVKIDRTTPTGGSVSAAKTSGVWANTPSPGLSGAAFTDANSGIDASAVRITRERAPYVDGGNTCSNDWTVDDTAVTISNGRDTDALDEACYRYTREAADNAGNAVASTPDTVQLDLTGPAGGAVTINGGTDVDATAGTPPTMSVDTFSDRLSGLRAGSETLTRRIAPWVGTTSSLSGAGTRSVRAGQEFGGYGSPVPVTLVGTADPMAVNPGRYFYEHVVVDESGNVSTRTALVEIRPRGYVPPTDPAANPLPVDPPPGAADPGDAPGAQASAPQVVATMRVARRRVRSGSVLPATLLVTNTGGRAGPILVSIRLRAGMVVAEMPRGARIDDGVLIIPIDGLAAGSTAQVKVFLRLTTTRTRKTIVRGSVRRAGAADATAASPTVMIVATPRKRGITG